MARIIVGVMGPGEGASEEDCLNALELGQAVARLGWVLLTGGRDQGVMDAASRGAKEAGGLTVGILPTRDRAGVSRHVDIAILTDLGQGRNNVNVLSSAVVFVCGMGPGTASEASLGLKAQRDVILIAPRDAVERFFTAIDSGHLHVARNVRHAVEMAQAIVEGSSNG